jgi:hypothetical protein
MTTHKMQTKNTLSRISKFTLILAVILSMVPANQARLIERIETAADLE